MIGTSGQQAHVRTPETDEILRRIGRNLLNFRQVEHFLKLLIANSSIVGPASEFTDRLDKQTSRAHRLTMGQLAADLIEDVLLPRPEQRVPDVIDEPWIHLQYSIDTDASAIERHEQDMQALVAARNELVHHFLPRWQAAIGGDAAGALAYLDAQRDETLRMRERLRSWVLVLRDAQKLYVEFASSPEFEVQIELALLRGSRLVAMLGEAAAKYPRPDGWTRISTAQKFIERTAPSELHDLPGRFGLSDLRAVLMASAMFDLGEASNAAGKTQPVYRVNERHKKGIG